MSYRHKEAFALMWYACEARPAIDRPAGCGHRERIWNSRDGVTPFGAPCPSCGGVMLHVEWHRDEPAPHYKPQPGQQFWRDGTPDEAEAIMRRCIEKMKDAYPCTPARVAELVALARSEGSEGEFQKGWPMLDRAGRP